MLLPTTNQCWCGIWDIFLTNARLKGIGQLFPWNVIINAENYFNRRFCGTVFERIFENSFSFGYNIAAAVGIVLAIRYQDRWNLRWRIMGSLGVSAIVFNVCGILVLVEKVDGAFLFFSTMTLILAVGLAGAFLQGGLFSMATAFPPKYTQAMMAGQGLAGVAVALAGLFTTLTGPDNQSCIPDEDTNAHRVRNIEGVTSISDSSCAAYATDWGTLVYFAIAEMVLLGCLATYPVLQRLPVTTYYTCAVNNNDIMRTFVNDAANSDIDGDDSSSGCSCYLMGPSLTVESNPTMQPSMNRRLMETPPMRLMPVDKVLSDQVVNQKPQGKGLVTDTLGDPDTSIDVVAKGLVGLRSKLAPISPYAFSVFFAFTVTLSLFPGATSLIVSSRQCQMGRSRFFASNVFVMFSFVSFNAFDFLGRLAAGLPIVLPSRWLPAASISRLVFVPLFLGCRSAHARFPHWLSADFFPLSIMPVFGFTNGYVGSLSMMAGSQRGPWAGTAMVLFLSGGLLIGSLLSFLVVYVSTTKA